MSVLFDSIRTSSPSISRGVRGLLFSLMVMESGCEGLLKQAQEALRLARFSFQQGASSLLEVLNAQRVQRDILQDYIRARFDLSVSQARPERGVGGLL